MPMVPAGAYALIDHADVRIGAMMTAGGGWPTCWTYYFNVPSIDATGECIEKAGSALTQELHEFQAVCSHCRAPTRRVSAFTLVARN